MPADRAPEGRTCTCRSRCARLSGGQRGRTTCRCSHESPGAGQERGKTRRRSTGRSCLGPREPRESTESRRRATYYHRLGAVGVGAGACERCDICGVSLSLIASGRELVHVPDAYIYIYISSRLDLPRLAFVPYFTASVSTSRCFSLMDVRFPTNLT